MSVIQRKIFFDWNLFALVSILLIFSLAVVYSASAVVSEYKFGSPSYIFSNHLRNVVVVFVVILIASRINYRIWQRISKPLLLFSILMLIVVLFVGESVKGAARWIDIFGFNFQPSEIAKFALILHTSKIIEERNSVISDFRFVVMPILVWSAIICGFVALQPNFSTATLILIIVLTMLFISQARRKHIFAMGSILVGISLVFSLTAEYRLNRIISFINVIRGGGGEHYQITQSLIAFANGGLFGVGPGGSRQSNLFLPESYGDFIFAVIGEEYGFVGIIFVLSVFALLIVKLYKVAKYSPDGFSFFFASGVMITFLLYFIVNAFVNLGLLPVTGVPMPFISYGGSSSLINGLSIGILMNIIANSKAELRNST